MVWLDSEEAVLVIARDAGDFVDALHLYVGSLYDVMAACQSRDRTWSAAELHARFDATWRADAIATARAYEGYEELEA